MSLLKLAAFIAATLLLNLSLGQGATCATTGTLTASVVCTTTSFSLSNGNSGLGSSSCISTINDDGWYQFTATDVFSTVQITGASNNIGFVVYSGTCASLTEIACDDQGSTSALAIFPTVIGTTYYVRIIRTSSGGGGTSGDICVTGSNACSNITILNEPFNGPAPLTGAITANIYGSGLYNGAAYILSGAYHGWFNIINGLGNVDVFDRQMNGFCIGIPATATFWTRESYGSTNVTYSIVDDLGATLASNTMTLTQTFQQITLNFTATTAGARFIIHCNSTGGSGIDVVIEDLLVSQCCPTIVLPIELSSFEGECTNNDVQLKWTTSSETNNAYFAIEQSSDMVEFKELGQVEGVGTSTEINNYSFRVSQDLLSSEVNYFRLKQCDMNGECTYTIVIATICDVGKISIFPNPGLNEIVITGNLSSSTVSSIVNTAGQIIEKTKYTFHNNNNVTIIDISGLSSGTYFLIIGDQRLKFMKE